jgi:hypothetical protein
MAIVLGLVGARPQGAARGEHKAGDRKAAGTLFERAKGVYAEQIPPFVRTGFRKYDESGEHFSVGYNRFFLLTTTVTAFTAYFYPAQAREDLAQHAAACRDEVIEAHPGAEVVATEKVTAAKNGRKHDGVRVRFRFEDIFGGLGKKQALVSELYVFRDGGRVVKYRVTFAEDQEKTERKHLEKFLSAFPWPE